MPRRIDDLGQVTAIAAGELHTCAIAGVDNGLFCWGDNSSAQLGSFEAETHSAYPVQVVSASGFLTNVKQVSTGALHTCAIHADNRLVCWGEGESGRLGDNNPDDHEAEIPRQVRRIQDGGAVVAVQDALQVVSGSAHSCLINTSRTVECWGSNTFGQLAMSPLQVANAATPHLVERLSAVEQIAAGPNHTCALTEGRVYCWGDNSQGQLGYIGPSTNAVSLVDGVSNVDNIVAGSWFACALDTMTGLRCWGSNLAGEVGCSEVPQSPFVPIDGVAAVSGGYGQHLCILQADGRAACRGNNNAGQLGDGLISLAPECALRPVLALNGSAQCDQP